MNVTLLATIALLLCATISGCKIAIVVMEGGHVEALTSPDCLNGSVCIVEVTDTTFSEEFTAIPNPGWKFVRWNAGGDFSYDGYTSPNCNLMNVPGAGHPFIEAVVASDQAFYIMPIFQRGQPITDTIVVDGREWAQADLFAEISWNEMNAICPAGVCSGSGTLNGYNMMGWTWASVDDIGALLAATTPDPGRAGIYSTFFTDNQWAKDFFDVVGFRPTGSTPPPLALRETVGFV
ncbi:MAG: hypothetical protein ACI9JM_002553 [Halioglobus sp.]|jgi:hypothetical protein